MLFSKVLENISYNLINGTVNIDIDDIVYDSRKANKNNIFIALPGTNVDGHDFISNAYNLGCRNFIVCKDIDIKPDMNIVSVNNTREVLGLCAGNLFNHPENKIKKIAITGTKGKTTTSFMIKNIFENAGYKIGVIGTMGVFINGNHYETKNTTPESYDIYKYMNEMVNCGCEYLVMEVSSLATKFWRVNGIIFDYGIFTNLTPDHIGGNEHKDFDEYRYCKSLLFKNCKTAILNQDDENFTYMINPQIKNYYFGINNEANINARDIKYIIKDGVTGSSFCLKFNNNNFNVFLDIPGEFNIYNAISAISVALLEDISNDIIVDTMKNFKVKGRLENVSVSSEYTVLIDYAHNGVSMESIINTMRAYPHNRIISLFGCGGERSKTRRYEMGEYSGLLADFSIITEDNSRQEPFSDIVNDILIGMKKTNGKYIVIEDRGEAIKYALSIAQKGDIILLLGKGHEDYMEKNGKKFHFDEREIIQKIIASC